MYVLSTLYELELICEMTFNNAVIATTYVNRVYNLYLYVTLCLEVEQTIEDCLKMCAEKNRKQRSHDSL